MNLILDTSILIELEKGDREVISKLDELRKIYPAPAKISFITYFEFLFGLKNKSIKNKDKLMEFLNKFSMIATNKSTAAFLVDLKGKYELPLADLFIAAQVLESKGVLFSKDKDFEMIKEMERIIYR